MGEGEGREDILIHIDNKHKYGYQKLEIIRHSIVIDCKAFKSDEENLIQTMEGGGEKRNKKHNKWKTQNKIEDMRPNMAIIININGLNSLIKRHRFSHY